MSKYYYVHDLFYNWLCIIFIFIYLNIQDTDSTCREITINRTYVDFGYTPYLTQSGTLWFKCIHMYAYMQMYVCICSYIYIYIYIYVFIYICIYTSFLFLDAEIVVMFNGTSGKVAVVWQIPKTKVNYVYMHRYMHIYIYGYKSTYVLRINTLIFILFVYFLFFCFLLFIFFRVVRRRVLMGMT
jgi:hypothetical protein